MRSSRAPASARPFFRRLRRFLLYVTAGALLLAIAGAIDQAWVVRSFATRFPPPGRMVDIGDGRRLHLLCIGSGAPTVIFEQSGMGSSLSSSRAREEVATATEVCSYDRAGMAWSDPGPAVLNAGRLVEDLERLIERGPLKPPFIFVTASAGGLTTELFARRHPEQIAGLVFVDAGNSNVLERVNLHLSPTLRSTGIAATCLAPTAARLGLLRAVDPFGIRAEKATPEAITRGLAMIYRPQPMATLCGMVRGRETTARELRDAPPLASDVPLTVLTAGSVRGLIPAGIFSKEEEEALGRLWREEQQQMARRSTRGQWRLVANSSHLIGNFQPHAVAQAVFDQLTSIKARASVRSPR